RREALVWKQLHHPNVLPFLGASEDLFPPSFCLISPWMTNGNLIDYLKDHPEHDRFEAITQICDAMRYLHEHSIAIVHADIRGGNILVSDRLQCVLADFGLASVAEPYTMTSASASGICGSLRWMAPEILLIEDMSTYRETQTSTSRDIYAFACTVVEIYTLKPPFHHISGRDVAVMNQVIAGKRPDRPDGISDGLWRLTQQCWSQDPAARPPARHIQLALIQIL
ncbi:kinase-like domain-containing protein, partial [Mycena floridula]